MINWLIRVAENKGPEQVTATKIATRSLALTSMFVFAIEWVFDAHRVGHLLQHVARRVCQRP